VDDEQLGHNPIREEWPTIHPEYEPMLLDEAHWSISLTGACRSHIPRPETPMLVHLLVIGFLASSLTKPAEAGE
jgi:hypothetical protein